MNKKERILRIIQGRFWEPLMVTFSGLFMVSIVANAATKPFNNELHSFFGTSDYKEIKATGEDEKTIDRKKLKDASNIEDYYRQVNEDVEAEGLVLLKNENHALPLADGMKVTAALSGTGKQLYATHGPGVRRDGEKQGAFYDLRKALKSETSLNVNDATFDFVETGAGKTARGQRAGTFYMNEPSWENYRSVQDEYSDSTVLAVITRESGEGADVSFKGSDGTDGSYLSLTQNELQILENLATLKSQGKVKKIVVLINSAVTLQCDFIDNEKYGIDACMWIGLPGATGMRGVAKALVGKVNPSGRLSDTFLKDNFAAPANMYWKVNDGFSSSYSNTAELNLNSTQQYYGVYVEGVYVGYRYFETRYEDSVMNREKVGNYTYSDVVAYPFGYGLSYSSFSYSDMTIVPNKQGDKVLSYEVSVKVTNTGSVSGKEAVQVYLQKPYNDHDVILGIEKPSVELVGFEKTKLLNPNESETVHMSVDFESLRSYDSEYDKTYILDEGDYYLSVARDSHDAINNILSKKGFNRSRGMDANGDPLLSEKILSQAKVDNEIFSKSSAKKRNDPTKDASDDNSVEITNKLDFMDPNRFKGVTNKASDDGDVTYVSRNDWMGTFPSVKTELSITENQTSKYDITSHKPIVEEKDATMPNFGNSSQKLTLAMMVGLKYDDPQWDMILDNLTQEEIFDTLVQCYGYTPEIASIAKPLTDEDDGPYGVSNTAEGYSSMSCEGIIASTFNKELYAKVGEAIASDARSGHDEAQKNLHGLYAPGLNIHRSCFGGRAAEYFSEDPYLTSIAAVEEIKEMQKQYVVACPKHFIFNDEESNRNGIGIWMNEQTAREIYLSPWEYALRPDKGNAHSLMTSFNRAGFLWTSASSDLMEEILRGEWAFDGYTLTDMAGSNGKLFMVYDDGFMNGTDCFLDKGSYSDMTSEMRTSNTFNQKQRESMHRLLYVVANYSAAMDGYSVSTKMVPVAVPWKVAIKSLVIVSGILASISLAVLCFNQFVKFKKI